LIGLGRSCLYAGAGALLVSLWNVDDNSTQALMESIYQSLAAGMSKAAALQLAQCQIIARHPTRHPAFWGAFQLIGNGDPLSNIP
jgi:CHAT domain-containing protein